MASVTHRVTTASTTNAESYTTDSFTPAVGDLLVVFVLASGTALAGSVTLSAGGITFTHVAQTTTIRVGMFVANSLVSSASAITATWDCTGDGATGAIISVSSISGMNLTGASAVKQSKINDAGTSGNPPTATFDASCLTGNPTMGVASQSVNPTGLTEPTGWTELADTGYNTPTNGLEVVSRDSGFTGTTITWGNNASTSWRVIIAEFDTSNPITVSPGTGALTYAGFAPTVSTTQNVGVTPGVGQVVYAGFAPTVTVTEHKIVTPGVGAVVYQGFAPTVTASDHKTVTPGTGAITYAGFAPTVSVSDNKLVVPGVGQLVYEGFAPTITVVSPSPVVTPGTGQLVFVGFAPTIIVSEHATVRQRHRFMGGAGTTARPPYIPRGG